MTSWMTMALHLQALVSQVHLAEMLHDSFFRSCLAALQQHQLDEALLHGGVVHVL